MINFMYLKHGCSEFVYVHLMTNHLRLDLSWFLFGKQRMGSYKGMMQLTLRSWPVLSFSQLNIQDNQVTYILCLRKSLSEITSKRRVFLPLPYFLFLSIDSQWPFLFFSFYSTVKTIFLPIEMEIFI